MNSQRTSFPIGTVLFLIFLVLKLTGVITWSWVWVTAPLWIGLGLFLVVVLPLMLIAALLVSGRR